MDEYFSVSIGDVIHTPSFSYLVEAFIGEGAFGKVAQCLKKGTTADAGYRVAVKINKNRPDMIASAEDEIAMLTYLQRLDPDVSGIVRWMGHFNHGPHVCLEFELLKSSLRDLTQQTEHHKLPLVQIRDILKQLAMALEFLGFLEIVHGDLKPQNIMVTRHGRIKLIDFGSAIHVTEAESGDILPTIWYRSPEIMLGLPFTVLIDMWSLGCIAAELLTGRPIYPCYTEYDMWRYILQTHGELPHAMLDYGIKTHRCFTKGSGEVWRLKEYEESEQRERLPCRVPFTSLEAVVQAGNGTIPSSFTDLLKRTLQLDPDKRITPSELLEHPFISVESEDQPNRSPGLLSPIVDHANSCSNESSVDHPNRCTREPSVDLPNSCSNESSVDHPNRYTREPSVDHPNSCTREPSVDHPNSCSNESSVDHPNRCTREPSVDQPNRCSNESSVDHPNRVPGTYTPLVPNHQEKATVDSTDRVKLTSFTPTTSSEVTMETAEVQPSVEGVQLEATQKPQKNHRVRGRNVYRATWKIIHCCCCANVLD